MKQNMRNFVCDWLTQKLKRLTEISQKKLRVVVDNIQNTNKCIYLAYTCVADVDSQVLGARIILRHWQCKLLTFVYIHLVLLNISNVLVVSFIPELMPKVHL